MVQLDAVFKKMFETFVGIHVGLQAIAFGNSWGCISDPTQSRKAICCSFTVVKHFDFFRAIWQLLICALWCFLFFAWLTSMIEDVISGIMFCMVSLICGSAFWLERHLLLQFWLRFAKWNIICFGFSMIVAVHGLRANSLRSTMKLRAVSTSLPRGDHGWRFTARCKLTLMRN